MKNTIKDLWFSYLIENLKMTDEEKSAVGEVLKAEEPLLKSLDKSQREMFEEYSSKLNSLNGICELNAFKVGLSFGCNFLLETLFCK